jgi:hypothetical protein
MAIPSRDPFAPLGTVGNRTLQLGTDGPIPAKYSKLMEPGIRLAYQLAYSAPFNATFEATLKKLGVTDVPKDAYLKALEKMIVHHAESSKNERAVAQLQEDAIAAKRDKTYQPPAAFSIVNGRDVWLRDSLLRSRSEKLVAGALMHEAAHLAGAPGNLLAEFGLEQLGVVSGYVRR